MKSGVIAAVVTLLAVGAAVPALAQTAPANLPPLIINSPDDVTVTQEGEFYWHVVAHSDFLIVDDGSANPDISCHIETSIDNQTAAPDGSPGGTKAINPNAYHAETNQNGVGWRLPDGAHSVLCTVIDEGGKLATASHSVSVDVRDPLFSSQAHSERIERIARLAQQGYINHEIYLKIIKYYHLAGMINFDIERDGSGGFTSGIRDDTGYCNDPGDYRNYARTSAAHWRDNRSSDPSHWDVWYKQCLEYYAESGAFVRINLGF